MVSPRSPACVLGSGAVCVPVRVCVGRGFTAGTACDAAGAGLLPALEVPSGGRCRAGNSLPFHPYHAVGSSSLPRPRPPPEQSQRSRPGGPISLASSSVQLPAPVWSRRRMGLDCLRGPGSASHPVLTAHLSACCLCLCQSVSQSVLCACAP